MRKSTKIWRRAMTNLNYYIYQPRVIVYKDIQIEKPLYSPWEWQRVPDKKNEHYENSKRYRAYRERLMARYR